MARRVSIGLISLLVAVGAGCGGEGDNATTTRRGPVALEPCPPSSWENGGGTDFEVAGNIACDEISNFMRQEFAPAGQTERGSALVFGDWVCAEQLTQESGPVEITCANGSSKFRLLFH
jgi:hypothetical protein